VTEAQDFFTGRPAARAILDRLADVGLGYLGLGQPLTTLSGGERQRLKLAIHMAEKAATYVLDEPTSGLHLADVDQLLALLDRLVDDGNSVIVIEHHQAVMAHADWIIDLGPGAGQDGGRVVFTGTPADLIASGGLAHSPPPAHLSHRARALQPRRTSRGTGTAGRPRAARDQLIRTHHAAVRIAAAPAGVVPSRRHHNVEGNTVRIGHNSPVLCSAVAVVSMV
jgi:ABC-type multidrug transport system ATPase subunit